MECGNACRKSDIKTSIKKVWGLGACKLVLCTPSSKVFAIIIMTQLRDENKLECSSDLDATQEPTDTKPQLAGSPCQCPLIPTCLYIQY
jgi:hypothetical protein